MPDAGSDNGPCACIVAACTCCKAHGASAAASAGLLRLLTAVSTCPYICLGQQMRLCHKQLQSLGRSPCGAHCAHRRGRCYRGLQRRAGKGPQSVFCCRFDATASGHACTGMLHVWTPVQHSRRLGCGPLGGAWGSWWLWGGHGRGCWEAGPATQARATELLLSCGSVLVRSA